MLISTITHLVGGFKHEFYFPFHIWDSPSHWLIFFKMGKPTRWIAQVLAKLSRHMIFLGTWLRGVCLRQIRNLFGAFHWDHATCIFRANMQKEFSFLRYMCFEVNSHSRWYNVCKRTPSCDEDPFQRVKRANSQFPPYSLIYLSHPKGGGWKMLKTSVQRSYINSNYSSITTP